MAFRSNRSATWRTTLPPRHSRVFCLDANISYRVAQAAMALELPLSHVALESELGIPPVQGQSATLDEDIAKWCGSRCVLVTCDNDFRTRWLTSGVLAAHGVEVICFKKQVTGRPRMQFDAVYRLFDKWVDTLGEHPPGHRVWVQPPSGRLVLQR